MKVFILFILLFIPLFAQGNAVPTDGTQRNREDIYYDQSDMVYRIVPDSLIIKPTVFLTKQGFAFEKDFYNQFWALINEYAQEAINKNEPATFAGFMIYMSRKWDEVNRRKVKDEF